MLGVIFRGIFLIGILTWYSTSVWKMIDSYFKDQFRSYLEEEYRKNPQMRSDIQSRGDADKVNPTVTTEVATETTVVPSRKVEEVCELDECTVEAAENDSTRIVPNTTSAKKEVTGGTSENEAAADGFIDKNAFSETVVELESRKPDVYDNNGESGGSINHGDDLERPKKKSKVGDRSTTAKTRYERTRKRTAAKNEKKIHKEERPKQTQQTKKRKVKIITLTQEDFAAARRGDVVDDDFWEFEEDAEEKEPVEGILVSELPFKPRADIGNLERVSAEEYCPLTLDDEDSCGKTVEWP